jgi:8-oxo-dGTP pyrophosphatase MutT (NUDIX family)
MQRPDYNGVHGGQISFPGGKMELHDKTLADTALRESKEEIGIDPRQVTILGELTKLYIPPSNFHISPFLASSFVKPEFTPDPQEVAAVIVLPVDQILSGQSIQQKKVRTGLGFSMEVPAFYINEKIIWGATAMILSEFREILLTMETTD